MKIDFTCPLELISCKLPTFNNNECSFVVKNLASQSISSIQVSLSSFDKNGKRLFKQFQRLSGFTIDSHVSMELSYMTESVDDVISQVLIAEQVWFDDGAKWKRGDVPMIEYTGNALPPGKRLNDLQTITGKDAIGFPSEQGVLWVCVCGRANPASEFNCLRCNRDKLSVFSKLNEASVADQIKNYETQLDEKASLVREKSSKMLEFQKKQEARRKKKRWRNLIILLTAVAAIFAAYIIITIGVPSYKLSSANSLFNQEKYEEALIIYTDTSNKYDNTSKINECKYEIAKAKLDSNEITELDEAIIEFQALDGFSNSDEMIMQAKYSIAKINLDNEDFETSIDVFSEIPNYLDSRVMLNQASYSQAVTLLNNNEYTKAYDIFNSLQNYSDSAEQAIICLYNMGVEALNSGKYEDAMILLEQTTAYEDSKLQLAIAKYGLAEEKLNEQDFARAGELYLEVMKNDEAKKMFPDLDTKSRACLYETGKIAYNENDYKTAVSSFASIVDYLDSKTMYTDSIIKIAEELINNEDYDGALAQLDKVSDDKQAKDLINESKYMQATIAIENGNNEEALQILSNLGDYSDSTDKINTLLYSQALDALNAKEYETAQKAFTELGNYKDSADLLKSCTYNIASQKLEAKEYAEAIELFDSLDNYQDSKTKASLAKYNQASELMEQKKYKEASVIFATITSYMDAKDLQNKCIYMLALDAIENEDLNTAISYFEQISDYEDSSLRAQENRYKLAEQAYNDGNIKLAGDMFFEIGQFRDAVSRTDKCYDEYYNEAALLARQYIKEENYLEVIKAITPLSIDNLPDKYDDLDSLYINANYNFANELYAQKDAFAALKYYNNIIDEKDVSSKKLSQKTYKLFGNWETEDGIKASFKTDGTCEIAGTKYNMYYADNYILLTGDSIETLEENYGLSNITDSKLTIRENNTEEKAVYKFKKISEAEPIEIIEDVAPISQIESTENPNSIESEIPAATTTPIPIDLN